MFLLKKQRNTTITLKRIDVKGIRVKDASANISHILIHVTMGGSFVKKEKQKKKAKHA